jgi:hypothetical protein
VAGVVVDDEGDRLAVRVSPADGADVSLELYAAAARKHLLESVLDVPVDVR